MNRYSDYIEVSNRILKSLSSRDESFSIYHYTGIDGFKSIIEKKQIRFTNRFYLNDKSEGIYALDLFYENIDLIFSDIPFIFEEDESIRNSLLQQIQDYKTEMRKERFQIFQASFSINDDSLCLWNYYTKGDGIKGFNIGFDSSKLCDSLMDKIQTEGDKYNKPYILSGKVIYKKSEQIQKIKEYITQLYNAIKAEEINNESQSFQKKVINTFNLRFSSILERITLLGVLFKPSCFEVENEYRIAVDLFLDDNNQIITIKNKVEYRTNSYGFLIPYIDFDFDLLDIMSVQFSPTMDKEETMENLKMFLASQSAERVQIKGSDIPVRY